MLRDFYEKHKNFSFRSLTDYYISPGIKCKFDLLKENIKTKRNFKYGIDLGSSGNSFLLFIENISQKFFYDIANLPLKQYSKKKNLHPLCGDLITLPYRDESFNFLTALDVLEHIQDDNSAISEMSRILKSNGIVIITVPHRMKYYTKQDRLIGHYRRYEITQIKSLFKKYRLNIIKIFGVYGRLMKIADIQSTSPEKTEQSILKIRYQYENNIAFHKLWNIIIKFLSKLMKYDAKYHSLKNIMNVAFIFKKQ